MNMVSPVSPTTKQTRVLGSSLTAVTLLLSSFLSTLDAALPAQAANHHLYHSYRVQPHTVQRTSPRSATKARPTSAYASKYSQLVAAAPTKETATTANTTAAPALPARVDLSYKFVPARDAVTPLQVQDSTDATSARPLGEFSREIGVSGEPAALSQAKSKPLIASAAKPKMGLYRISKKGLYEHKIFIGRSFAPDRGRLLASGPKKPLRGHVSMFTQEEPIAQQVAEVIQTALDRNDEFNNMDNRLAKQSTTGRKMLSKTVDAAHFVLMFKGVSPSSEAGDVILSEKSKAKSVAATEYLKQRQADDTELTIISHFLQMAMGLGNPDRAEGAQQAEEARQALIELAGEEETAKLSSTLRSMAAGLSASPTTNKVWSISQKRQLTKDLMTASLDTDPIIQEIKKRVWKYNHRSKIDLASQRIIRTSLSLAGLTPSLVAPAAQTALFAYIMVSGGSEEDKLLKELYLDRRLDSRSTMISETAHLALENYQMATLTGNALLKESCAVLFRQMAGPDRTQALLAPGASPAPAKEPQALLQPNASTAPAPSPGAPAPGMTQAATQPGGMPAPSAKTIDGAIKQEQADFPSADM